MNKIVLIMTCGHTDVQFVASGKRWKFAKRRTSEVHDALKDHTDRWNVVATPPETCAEDLEELPTDGSWNLCTPKLDAVIEQHFESRPPDTLLLLETKRAESKEDPRYSGEVLKRRAARLGVQDVMQEAYLRPEDKYLEDRECPEDAIVRREVAKRLEDAICKAVSDADRVVVAAVGGMPEIKLLVRELVRLHVTGDKKVEFVEVDDGSRKGRADEAVIRQRLDPVETVRARRHAWALIEKGHIIGAWGVAKPIQDERSDQGWTRVVEGLYCFASSLPMPKQWDNSMPVVTNKIMAVRAALRVEMALLAGDIPRAVHGTVSFFEAALWDCLRKRDFHREDGASGNLTNGFTFTVDPTGEKKTRFRKSKGEAVWRINPHRDGVDAWVRVLNEAALTAYESALSDQVRNLRNDVAHGEPSETLMNAARVEMRTALLWSQADTFLSQPLVQNVLDELLGVTEPDKLWDRLRTDVRKRILDPQPRAST